jgi:hypothetical protein
MSFVRMQRTLFDQPPPVEVEPNGIVIKWRDMPEAPSLIIVIGDVLARQMGFREFRHRALILLGEGNDQGKLAIVRYDAPDSDYRVQPVRFGVRVYVPCHIAVKHFAFGPAVAVPPSDIVVTGDRTTFAFAGLKP